MPFYSRKNTRIPNYDYSTQNYYFVTICTYEKKCIFGKPGALSLFGRVAESCIKKTEEVFPGITVDNYVIMPNHIHAIFIVGDNKKQVSLSTVIGQYKAAVTKQIRKIKPDTKVWQRSFHDHIIRDQASYEKIWSYVEHNALKWEDDCFYMNLPL